MGQTAASIPIRRIAPWREAVLLTPSDDPGDAFAEPYDAIICQGTGAGTVGEVTVDFADDGGDDILLPVLWGYPVHARVSAVKATGTNADMVIGLRYGTPE